VMRFRKDRPVETWEGMKEKLRLKYVLLSFSQQLLHRWNVLNSRKQVGYRLHRKI